MDTVMEEVHALEATLMDDVVVTYDGERPVRVSVLIHPATADCREQQYVQMSLLFTLPVDYPISSPRVSVERSRGVDEQLERRIMTECAAKMQLYSGEPVIYTLLETARERLTEANRPAVPCAICLYDFTAADCLTRTACYHYYHQHCLARYLDYFAENQLEDAEPVPAWQPTPEPRTPGCPVCREQLTGDILSLSLCQSPPPPQPQLCQQAVVMTTSTFSPQLRALQQQMAALYTRQVERGAVVEVNTAPLIVTSEPPADDAANTGSARARRHRRPRRKQPITTEHDGHAPPTGQALTNKKTTKDQRQPMSARQSAVDCGGELPEATATVSVASRVSAAVEFTCSAASDVTAHAARGNCVYRGSRDNRRVNSHRRRGNNHLDHQRGGNNHLDHQRGGNNHLDRRLGGNNHLDHQRGDNNHLGHRGGGNNHLNRRGGGNNHLDHQRGDNYHLEHQRGDNYHLEHRRGGNNHLDRSGGGNNHLDRRLGGNNHLDHQRGDNHRGHRGSGNNHLEHRESGNNHLDRRGGGDSYLEHRGGGNNHPGHRGGGNNHLNRRGGGNNHLDHQRGHNYHLEHQRGGNYHLEHQRGDNYHLEHRGGDNNYLDHQRGDNNHLDHKRGGNNQLDRSGGGNNHPEHRGGGNRQSGGRGGGDSYPAHRGGGNRQSGGRGGGDSYPAHRGGGNRQSGGRGGVRKQSDGRARARQFRGDSRHVWTRHGQVATDS